MFDEFIQLAVSYGLPGLGLAALVLIGVFFAKRGGLVATGTHARIANVLLAVILAGLSDNPEAEKGLLAAMAAILSALAYTAIEILGNKTFPKWFPPKLPEKG